MQSTEQIEIKLSKLKLIRSLVMPLLFIGLGLKIIIVHPQGHIPVLDNPAFILFVGIANILFSGFILSVYFRGLIQTSPGIIISEEGITNNTGGVNEGFIPWKDIVEIKGPTAFGYLFINVVVKNPQDYINKQKNAFKRRMMKMNFSSNKKIFRIPANRLNCTYNQLKAILDNKFAEYKNTVVI